MGLVFNKNAAGQESSNGNLTNGRGGYAGTSGYVQPAAPQYTPAQMKTISSFRTLDVPTRQALVSHFQKTDPAKYQLLKDHASDGGTQNTQFQDAPTFKNKGLNWLSNAATETVAKPIMRGQHELYNLETKGKLDNPKQFASDVVQTGTNFATMGPKVALKGAQIGIDGLVKFGAKQAAAKVAASAGKSAALNATLNATSTYGAGGNTKQIVQSAAAGAAFGAGLGGAAGAAGIRGVARDAAAANGAITAGRLHGLNDTLTTANKADAAAALKIHNAATEAPKALPSPSGRPLTTDPKALPAGSLRLEPGGPRTMTPEQTSRLSDIDRQIADIQASRANPKVVNSQLQTARDAGDAAGVKAAATARNTISIKANQTNTPKLMNLLDQRTKIYDEVHNPTVKAGPDTPKLSRTDRKVAAIDAQLNDFKTNPKTAMDPETAKVLQKQRNDLVTGKTQVSLDKIVARHSAETGQPLTAAHETVAAGQSPHSADYAATQAAGKEAKMTGAIGQDWVDGKKVPPVNEHDELSASAPDRGAEAQKQGGAFRSMYNEARSWMGAPTASRLSRETSMGLNEATASTSNAKAQLKELKQNRAAEDYFNKNDEAKNVASISHYERTGAFNDEPHPGYSEQYHKDMDRANEVLAEVYGDDKVGYVDNYVRRNLEFADPHQAGTATNLLMRQFGSKSPLKGRTMDMPLDEALQTLRDKGIDVKPITHNPETLRQWTMINAHKAKVFDQAFKDNLSRGTISTTQRPGMVPVKRDVVQSLSPANSGKDHFAYPEVNRILENATGRGLKDSALYRGARAASAGLGQVTLALPAFHATTTTIHSLASEINNGLLQARAGQLVGAGKSLLNSATVIGPTIKNAYLGNKLMRQVKAGEYGTDAIKVLNLSGAHLAMSHEMESGAIHAMKAAWSQDTVKSTFKAMGLSPFALAEAVSNPLMKSAIPRIKLGAMLDRAGQIVDEHGGLNAPGTKEALQNAQRSIDNRLGEIVMSNKQWNPVVRDIAQLLYLSVGYRGGTVGELGGGLKDLAMGGAKNGLSLVTGKGAPNKIMTERSTFLASTLIAGAYTGAIYQYLHTGKMPQSLSEAFYPKNGQQDANGNDVRVRLPGYTTDLFNLVRNPVKEVKPNAPLLGAVMENMSNRDWKGDEIRNPDDSIGKQVQQTGKDLAGRVVPIAVQNQTKKNGINKLEAFLGASKAPTAVGQTKAQKEINHMLDTQPGLGGAKTPEQQDLSALKAKARDDLKAGKDNSANVTKLKSQLSEKAYKDFLSTKDQNPLQRAFGLLSTDNKIKLIKDNKPADLKGVSLNGWLVTAANDYKTGNAKDLKGLKEAMTKVGVDDNKFKSLLDQGKAARHASYVANKGKPKTNNKW